MFDLQQAAKQCSLVFLSWMQLRCTSRWILLFKDCSHLTQVIFGDEVRMEANFEVENKTYAPTAAKDSPFDVAITVHLRSKKSRSCLHIFFVLDIFLQCLLGT